MGLCIFGCWLVCLFFVFLFFMSLTSSSFLYFSVGFLSKGAGGGKSCRRIRKFIVRGEGAFFSSANGNAVKKKSGRVLLGPGFLRGPKKKKDFGKRAEEGREV